MFMPLTYANPNNDVDVGVYFYTWYQEGWGSPHWNDTISNNVVDLPLMNYYGSNDTQVIKQQMKWIDEAQIDFCIHAFWGINDYTDNSSQKIFNITDTYDFNVSHAILIDPFNGTGYYNWTQLYDYIWDNYVDAYNCYYTLYAKPLLLMLEQCFEGWQGAKTRDHFNNPDDPRFTMRYVGSHWVSDWFYGDVDSLVRDNYDLRYRLNVDGHMNIFPRFDEFYIGRSNPARIDYDLTHGLYGDFWNLALDYAEKGSLKILTIASWNEFHERHAIEPLEDYTSTKDSYFLYRQTCDYIDALKNPIAPTLWYENPITFGFIVIGLILAGYILVKL